ncbi:MAG: hypothetical protein IJJ91_04705 [Synergistaceae bacterium]|nr:hypothetical protein [Synergistaceae bacterium]
MRKISFARILIVAVAMFAFSAGMSFADIADPYRFRPRNTRGRTVATFSLSPSESEENVLKLRLRALTDGTYSYTFSSEDVDGSSEDGKIIESSTASCDKGVHVHSFSFAVPEEGKALTYLLEASFSPASPIEDDDFLPTYRKSVFTRNITVRRNKGTVYVFIEGK